jgi:hypothetical protein
VKLTPEIKVNLIKGVVAFLIITGVIVLAARDGGSTTSSLKIGFIFLGSIFLVAMIAIPMIVADATFSQFLIRNGAVDTKWLMFDSDPPGLAALREQVKETSKSN